MKLLRWVTALVAFFMLLAQPRMASADEGEVRVEAALHQGFVGGGAIRWQSRFIVDAPLTSTGDPWVVRFAAPLPAGEALTGPDGVTPIIERGHITGVSVFPAAVPGRALTITLVQPLDAKDERLHLGAPLAAGDALQIVDVSGEDGARFEPDPALGLERRVSRFAPRGLGSAAREECERLLGYHPSRRNSAPLYVRADGAIAQRGGIDGALVTRAERLRGGVLGAAIASVVIASALVIARRRLSRAALEEEATALLDAEFQALERRAPKRPRPE